MTAPNTLGGYPCAPRERAPRELADQKDAGPRAAGGRGTAGLAVEDTGHAEERGGAAGGTAPAFPAG